jgi:hypothetical protein
LNNALQLTDEQKRQIETVLSVGCDRQTAVDFVGSSLGDLRRAMERDAAFAATVRRTEAVVEFTHLRRLHEIASDPKNWRISVWWLERRSPERFGSRAAGAVTTRQLKLIISQVIEALAAEVHDARDRERLVARFRRLVEELEQMLSDLTAAESHLAPSLPSMLASDIIGPDELEDFNAPRSSL